MISICIPVYNYDVRHLVEKLSQQAESLQTPYEILVIDDASTANFQAINSQIKVPNFRYISLKKNIGRSKIRNILSQESRYPYLIFMDCDSEVASSQYLSDYLGQCKPGIVCYGGCAYHSKPESSRVLLRHKYGIQRECKPAQEREEDPNMGFRTNNFLIDKLIFQSVVFDEEINQYGHEDTLFGLELESHGIIVQHIDNPLIHLGLEDNFVYLLKTKSSLSNLRRIEKLLVEKKAPESRYPQIIRIKQRLEKLYLKKTVAILFRISKSALEKKLTGKNPDLFLFDVYRLGYYCNL